MALFIAIFLLSPLAWGESRKERIERYARQKLAAPLELKPDFNSLKSSISFLASARLHCRKKSDCRVFPIDTRPCGGPGDHLVTGKQNPHLGAIVVLNAKLVEKRKQYFAKNQLAGACVVPHAPGFDCVKGRCLIK